MLLLLTRDLADSLRLPGHRIIVLLVLAGHGKQRTHTGCGYGRFHEDVCLLVVPRYDGLL